MGTSLDLLHCSGAVEAQPASSHDSWIRPISSVEFQRTTLSCVSPLMITHTKLTLPHSLFLVKEIWAGLGTSILALEEQVAVDIDQIKSQVVAGGHEQVAGESAGDKVDLTHLSSHSSKGEKSAESCYVISSDSSQEVCADEAVKGSGSLARQPQMPEHMQEERGRAEVRVEKQDDLLDSCGKQASISFNTTQRVVSAGGCSGVSQRHRCQEGREGNNWDTCSHAPVHRLPSISTSGSDILDSSVLSQDADPRVAPAAGAIAGTATAKMKKTCPLFRTKARCETHRPEHSSSSLDVCRANERHPETRQRETSTRGEDAGKPPVRLQRRKNAGVFPRAGAD